MTFPALDPILHTYRPQDCNDGGGRNGRPTLLSAIARRRDADGLVRLGPTTLEDISEEVGHSTLDTTRQELKQMERREMVGLLDRTVFDARGKESRVLHAIGITAKGRAHLLATE